MRINLTTYIMVLLVGFGTVQAQEISPVLKNGDIDHFIKSFKPMTTELEALGHTFNASDENDNEMNPMADFANMRMKMKEVMSKNEVLTILKKYDWDENFLDIYIAVSMGYFYNTINMELDKMDDAEKEMAKPMMDMFLNQITLMVHKDDIEMLKPRMADLDIVFEDM